MSLAEGWEFRIAERVPAAMSPETAGTQRADRDGVSVTPPLADTEGPWPGTRCWVAVETSEPGFTPGERGVRGSRAPVGWAKRRGTPATDSSERSERGRASDEEPRTRLAKENPRSNKKSLTQ